MAVRLKCPHCEEKFLWQFSDKNQWPKHCPECGEYVGNDRADDDIVMPNILSPSTKSNDRLYRDMETASEQRVHAAAEMAGCDASDMSGLKITNLNDRRDAEIAAMPINNEVTRAMAAPNADRAMGFQANGAMLSPDVMSGPAPNAGARMRTVLHNYHQHQVAKHLPGLPTDVVSERPGNETTQPGYRRRG
ncbi:MAG TPA: hypothetical protein VLJ17_24510 [Xanthobacteraceae bacterium]|nr:hypothetical protein [Xanthobacteraceae bacterium]